MYKSGGILPHQPPFRMFEAAYNSNLIKFYCAVASTNTFIMESSILRVLSISLSCCWASALTLRMVASLLIAIFFHRSLDESSLLVTAGIAVIYGHTRYRSLVADNSPVIPARSRRCPHWTCLCHRWSLRLPL